MRGGGQLHGREGVQVDASLRSMFAELVRRAERVDIVTLVVKRIRTGLP